ncbi:unnamed protein product [Lupinus luteus]|uniref:Uncharacterized protein n=1 Tax=Lupinus luteus TaxID=3873 RepID=A0AAV1VXI3_LUPLU
MEGEGCSIELKMLVLVNNDEKGLQFLRSDPKGHRLLSPPPSCRRKIRRHRRKGR